MNFELDKFLATLKGLNREQTCTSILSKQDELMFEVSQPKGMNGRTTVFRSYRHEITFLHNLQNEINFGLVIESTHIDRLRMDNILNNIN